MLNHKYRIQIHVPIYNLQQRKTVVVVLHLHRKGRSVILITNGDATAKFLLHHPHVLIDG